MPKPPARPQLAALEDRATPVAGFVLSNNALIPIETQFPTIPRPAVAVTGLGPGETLAGIDFRPQNGHLYGLTRDGTGGVRLYALSHRTGVATPLTPVSVRFADEAGNPVAVGGTAFGFDFNPTVDRARVVTDAGVNFRMDPNTGAIVDGDTAKAGVQPDAGLNGGATAATGTAYTNNAANVTATTQYTLDAGTDKLFIQNPPNDGKLTANLSLTLEGKPLDTTAVGGFDIPATITVSKANAPAAGSAFPVLTVGGKTGLYAVNLADGKTALIGPIGSGAAPVQGFALAPAETRLIGFDGTNLLRFSSAAPDKVTTAKVSGVAATEVLVGIDFRPATGQLYGLGVDAAADTGTLYRIDPQTGAAAAVGMTGAVAFTDDSLRAIDLPAAAAGYGFDFFPTVDRVRVVTGTGLNFRLNPNDGTAVDGNGGAFDNFTPAVNPDGRIRRGATGATGAAYTNSFAGATVTTLYTLDPATDKLFIQNQILWNSGDQSNGLNLVVPSTNRSVPLPVLDFTAVNGFDIPPGVSTAAANAAAPGKAFAALTVGGKSGLYAVSLSVTRADLDTVGGPPGTQTFADPLGAIGDGATPLVGLTVGDGPPARRIDLFAVGAGPGLAATVKVYNPDGQVRFTLTLYESTFTGGVLVATGDVTGDGIDDIITGTGAGGGPRVRVFDGATAQPVREFFPYEDTFRGGVLVAAGDVDGDGRADIVTGTGVGGGPRVQVFDGRTQGPLANFFAYEDSFRGGVQVAAGDADADGKADVIAGTGVGGGPRVRVFAIPVPPPGQIFIEGPPDPTVRADFFAFEPAFRGGVTVAGGDVTGDGVADLIAGTGPGGGPRVVAFDGKTNGARVAADFFAFDQAFRGGVQVSSVDRDADGVFDIVTGTGPGTGNRVLVYAAGGTQVVDVRPFDAPFTGGVFVG